MADRPQTRWQQIEALFEAAIERPPDDRDAFLRQACAHDSDLYDEVVSLVSHDAAETANVSWAAAASASLLRTSHDSDGEAKRLGPGATLGPYTIVDVVGAGAMGEVYRARDARLNRDVAIKALPREFARDAPRLTRLEREARVLGSLSHPNIAGIHDLFDDGNGPYLVLEFVEGEDLAERLRRGPVRLEDVLRIGSGMAAALQAAHAKSIVHRDLKPANIRITPDGQVKVLDFGIALSLAEPEEGAVAGRTRGGSAKTLLAGTPAYMSPEQAAGQPVDQRADIWAFGCVLFELLTLRKAFVATTDASTLDDVLRQEPEWDRLQGKTPEALQQLIRRCLRRDPTGQVPDAGELQRTLAKIEERDGGSDPRGPRRWATIAVALTILAAIALVAWRARPGAGELRVTQTRQLTFAPALELDPALSPDGARIAYAASDGTRTDIYIRAVAGGEPANLTRALEASEHRWPRWSPDGTRIAFVSLSDTAKPYWSGAHAIQVVAASGGVPDQVAVGGILGHTWSPDGRRLAFAHDDEIDVSSLDGTPVRRLARAASPHSLAWSPDGRWIAFVSQNYELLFSPTQLGNVAPSAIEIVAASGGEPRRLTDLRSANISPSWTPDSRSILFVSNRDGNRDVFRLRLSDAGEVVRPPVRLTTGLNALSIDVSADGRQLLYLVFTMTGNLWSIGIPKSTTVSVQAARPLSTGAQVAEGVDVSPDGKWLAFDSNLAGNQDIYRVPVTGGTPEQLTTDKADDFSPSWSPDGQSIAFHTFRHGNRDIYVMSADGTRQQQVTRDAAQERYPDWSPDGQSLVFYSDQTGHREAHIVSRRDGGWGPPRRLTFTADTQHPHWSPDGRRIAYIDLARGVFSIPTGGGEPRLLVAATPTLRPFFLTWSRDGRSVYFRAAERGYIGDLWSVPATGGAPPRPLVRFDAPSRIEFATDGKRFFFAKTERQSDVWILTLEAAR